MTFDECFDDEIKETKLTQDKKGILNNTKRKLYYVTIKLMKNARQKTNLVISKI